jgi:hypothetical protein
MPQEATEAWASVGCDRLEVAVVMLVVDQRQKA